MSVSSRSPRISDLIIVCLQERAIGFFSYHRHDYEVMITNEAVTITNPSKKLVITNDQATNTNLLTGETISLSPEELFAFLRTITKREITVKSSGFLPLIADNILPGERFDLLPSQTQLIWESNINKPISREREETPTTIRGEYTFSCYDEPAIMTFSYDSSSTELIMTFEYEDEGIDRMATMTYLNHYLSTMTVTSKVRATGELLPPITVKGTKLTIGDKTKILKPETLDYYGWWMEFFLLVTECYRMVA